MLKRAFVVVCACVCEWACRCDGICICGSVWVRGAAGLGWAALSEHMCVIESSSGLQCFGSAGAGEAGMCLPVASDGRGVIY